MGFICERAPVYLGFGSFRCYREGTVSANAIAARRRAVDAQCSSCPVRPIFKIVLLSGSDHDKAAEPNKSTPARAHLSAGLLEGGGLSVQNVTATFERSRKDARRNLAS